MRIERIPPDRMTLAEFADRHRLTMQVVERNRVYIKTEDKRFYASFKSVERSVCNGHALEGTHGDGPTEDAAMADYAAKISGEKLVINAFTPERKEVYAPELTHTPDSASGSDNG